VSPEEGSIMTTVARTRTHTDPPVVTVHSHWGLDLLPGVPLEHPTFLRNAARSTRLLPAEVHDVLADFADDSGPKCEDRTPAECSARGGVNLGAGSCTPNPCD
jgi:hypothetical protein